MSRKLFEGVCPKCDEYYDILCLDSDLRVYLDDFVCTCGHIGLKRVWSFGSYKMKSGATRSGTK